MKLSPKPKPDPLKTLLLLLLPAVLLTGCATPSTASAPVCPAFPSPPPLSQPIPQPSYSERAQRDIATWQQRLTATPVTP